GDTGRGSGVHWTDGPWRTDEYVPRRHNPSPASPTPPAEGENTGRTLPRPSKCRGPPGCAFPPPPGSPAGKGWILRSQRTLFRTGEGCIRKNNGAAIRRRKSEMYPDTAR